MIWKLFAEELLRGLSKTANLSERISQQMDKEACTNQMTTLIKAGKILGLKETEIFNLKIPDGFMEKIKRDSSNLEAPVYVKLE